MKHFDFDENLFDRRLETILSQLSEEDAAYVKQLVEIDGLTLLYNQTKFLSDYSRIKERLERGTDIFYSMILADGDNFKEYNDQFGHSRGDHVLAKIGEIISLNIREFDRGYRIGGEEFAIILPGVGMQVATRVAQRIRQRVEENEIGITLSLGVAQYVSGGPDLKDMADSALYDAKNRGRNIVVPYERSLLVP